MYWYGGKGVYCEIGGMDYEGAEAPQRAVHQQRKEAHMIWRRWRKVII